MSHAGNTENARKRLSGMKEGKSYAALVAALAGQFSKGYLSAVIRGTRPASPRLERALGLRKTYKPHPVMRRSKIDRAVLPGRYFEIWPGEEGGVCYEDDQRFASFDTLSELIDWLSSNKGEK